MKTFNEFLEERGVPKKDGSGKGKRLNKGRGGCKDTQQKGKGINETAPPDPEIEKLIKKLKPKFKKQYGDDWKEVLYSWAWKKYNEKHGK